MNKYNKIVFVNGSAPPLNADNLNHMDEGIERATDGAIALETEIATARGGQNSLGARLDTTDANLTKKADKTSTLAGYGITDAYTKEKTDQKLAQKLNSMPFDSEPKYNSPCYLTSGTVYKALQTKADKTETDNSLAEKADKVDVDVLLANKANLVNSSNIFDFDAWAKELQKSSKPIIHGTLDELNFDEKSITFTATEKDTYTNSWQVVLAGTCLLYTSDAADEL